MRPPPHLRREIRKVVPAISGCFANRSVRDRAQIEVVASTAWRRPGSNEAFARKDHERVRSSSDRASPRNHAVVLHRRGAHRPIRVAANTALPWPDEKIGCDGPCLGAPPVAATTEAGSSSPPRRPVAHAHSSTLRLAKVAPASLRAGPSVSPRRTIFDGHGSDAVTCPIRSAAAKYARA